jgi:hypothetical protein
MDKDFEVKRVVLGLSTLICEPNLSEQCVIARTPDFVNAIMFLCQKSFEIKDKKNAKVEEAEVDEERGIIFDDEGDEAGNFLDEGEDIGSETGDEWGESDEEEDNDLYDTKLDAIDEVLFFKEKLDNL